MKHLVQLVLPLLLATLGCFASYHYWLEPLDSFLYDNALQQVHLPYKSDILIIAIDEQSVDHLGRWPWPRSTHAQLLNKLTDAGSRAVVFDILFSDPDKQFPHNDQQLQKAIKDNGRVFLPLYFENLNNKGQLIEVPPIEPFFTVAKDLGHAHIACDNDGVCRSVFLKEGLGEPYWPHISLAVFNSLIPPTEKTITRDSTNLIPGARFPENTMNTGDTDSNTSMLLYRDFHNYIPFNSQQPLPIISYNDVLQNRIPPALLKDKIIFIGATAAGINDILTTPVGRMPGVEISALILQRLIDKQLIQRAQPLSGALFTLLLTLALLSSISYFSPAQFLLASVVSLGLVMVLMFVSIAYFMVWIPIAASAVAIGLFYPLWSWLRLELALRYLKSNLKLIEQSGPNLNNELSSLLFSPSSKTRAIVSGSEVVSNTIAKLYTANRQAETSRQLLQQSIDRLHEAVVVFDSNHGVLLYNQQTLHLLPTHIGPLSLQSIAKALRLEDNLNFTLLLDAVLNEGKEFQVESAVQTYTPNNLESDTKQLYIQGCRIDIKRKSLTKHDTDYSVPVAVLTLTDITELKRSEQNRMETLNFISHDLRSPMVSILALISSARKNRSNNSFPDELLSQIENYANRNLSYAESLLQLSRAESHNTQFQLCDMHAVVDDAHSQFLTLAHEKNMLLAAKKEDADFWVMGDYDLLQRMLSNLLSNAIKYSPQGTTVNVSLQSDTLNDLTPCVAIAVCDQGTGIEPSEVPQLFRRFKRLDNAEHIEGSGLGLYFVDTVVKQHSGTVEVQSKTVSKSSGTCFTIKLPLTSVDDFIA